MALMPDYTSAAETNLEDFKMKKFMLGVLCVVCLIIGLNFPAIASENHYSGLSSVCKAIGGEYYGPETSEARKFGFAGTCQDVTEEKSSYYQAWSAVCASYQGTSGQIKRLLPKIVYYCKDTA